MKNLKTIILMFVLFFIFFVGVIRVQAACVDSDASAGRYTLSGSCSFAENVDGIDANGANSTNSAILTVTTGVTLTVDQNQTIATGIIDLKGGGSIIITKGGTAKILLKQPLYITDIDGDTYPASPTLSTTSTGRVRLYTIPDANRAVLDCNDSLTNNQNTLSTTYYPDSDLDNYTATAVTGATDKCSTASTWNTATQSSIPGVASNNATFTAGQRKAAASASTDCNDTGTNSSNVFVSFSGSCYTDADDDNYGTGSLKTCGNNATCGSAAWASGGEGTAAASGDFYSNANDCEDDNVAVYPGTDCSLGTCSICATTGGSCGYKTAGEQGQPVCTRCNGSSYTPVNITNNTQDTEGSNLCTATCKKCSAGSCINQTNAQDLFNQCAATGIVVRPNEQSNETCTQKCDNFSHTEDLCSGSSAACATHIGSCASIGTDTNGTNTYYTKWNSSLQDCVPAVGSCSTTMAVTSLGCQYTRCRCQ